MPESARLFFALWPDAAIARRLADCAPPGLDARRRVPVEQLHLTLLFLGAVEPRLLPQLRFAAERSRVPAFTLNFDHCGQFEHAEVLWVGASATDELQSLVAALGRQLQGVLRLRAPRHFVPHVTLARRTRVSGRMDCAPVAWPVTEFRLVESRPGDPARRYQTLERWPLGP